VLERLHSPDHVFEQLLFAPEFLRLLGLVPDLRVFQFLGDLGEPVDLYIDVKDTSAGRSAAS
jgi:hypothetical protein